MPRQVVAAPPAAPRPINLRTSARLVDDGIRWENGITFRPEVCDTGYSIDPSCENPSENPKASGNPGSPVEWDPYGIYVWDSCPYTLNQESYDDLAARARRSLEAQTSHVVEGIFWSGVVDGDDFLANHPNIALRGTTTVGTPAPPVGAFAQMEELLIGQLGGRRGMIHVPAALIPQLLFYGLLRREGNVWETGTGHIVVPGTGYSGTDPDNEEDPIALWIYGTSMVELRLSPVEILPGDLASAVNRDTNQIVVRAERLALAYWDLCAHVGVPVCTTDPGPACGTES